MKLKIRRLWPDGSPVAFVVDAASHAKLSKVRWRFIPAKSRARGFFGRGTTRKYLHRYVLELARRYYPDVTFANGDYWDCRLANLIAFDPSEHGATRRLFSNSTSRRKGVSWHQRKGKWAVMIRVKGKLRHLGYYERDQLEEAARQYAIAWNESHPELPPVPVIGR